jgi:hypothetical protein
MFKNTFVVGFRVRPRITSGGSGRDAQLLDNPSYVPGGQTTFLSSVLKRPTEVHIPYTQTQRKKLSAPSSGTILAVVVVVKGAVIGGSGSNCGVDEVPSNAVETGK